MTDNFILGDDIAPEYVWPCLCCRNQRTTMHESPCVDCTHLHDDTGCLKSPPMVDYPTIKKIMDSLEDSFGDISEGSACTVRCLQRMLAEALGLPLGSYRLLKETGEPKPLYRKES